MTADPPSERPLTWGFSADLTVLNAPEFRLGNAPLDLARKRSQVQTLLRPPHGADQRKRWSGSPSGWVRRDAVSFASRAVWAARPPDRDHLTCLPFGVMGALQPPAHDRWRSSANPAPDQPDIAAGCKPFNESVNVCRWPTLGCADEEHLTIDLRSWPTVTLLALRRRDDSDASQSQTGEANGCSPA
jgi:hypothetical protein